MLPNLQSSITINSALAEALGLSCTSTNNHHCQLSYEHNLNLFYYFFNPWCCYMSSFCTPWSLAEYQIVELLPTPALEDPAPAWLSWKQALLNSQLTGLQSKLQPCTIYLGKCPTRLMICKVDLLFGCLLWQLLKGVCWLQPQMSLHTLLLTISFF